MLAVAVPRARAAADSPKTEAMPAGRVWLALRPCKEPVVAGEQRMVVQNRELSSNYSNTSACGPPSYMCCQQNHARVTRPTTRARFCESAGPRRAEPHLNTRTRNELSRLEADGGRASVPPNGHSVRHAGVFGGQLQPADPSCTSIETRVTAPWWPRIYAPDSRVQACGLPRGMLFPQYVPLVRFYGWQKPLFLYSS